LDLLALRLQFLLITINTALSLIIHFSSSSLQTHYDSPSSLVVSWQWISTQKLAFKITMKSSCHFLFNIMEPRNSTKNSPGLSLAASGLVLYGRSTDNAENTVLFLCSTDNTGNTSHVIAKQCWDVTSMRVRVCVYRVVAWQYVDMSQYYFTCYELTSFNEGKQFFPIQSNLCECHI
jgi:hypothetical protein